MLDSQASQSSWALGDLPRSPTWDSTALREYMLSIPGVGRGILLLREDRG